MISCEKGYIEIMEYPRAWEARITYVETGDVDVIRAGEMQMHLLMNLKIWKKRLQEIRNVCILTIQKMLWI